MNKPEKLLYQVNKISYMLTLLYIIINIFYCLVILNSMYVVNPETFKRGYLVMWVALFNIGLVLYAFLIAVQAKNYKLTASYVLFGLGLLQFLRIFFFIPKEISGSNLIILILLLIASGVLVVVAGLITYKKSKIRRDYIEENNIQAKNIVR